MENGMNPDSASNDSRALPQLNLKTHCSNTLFSSKNVVQPSTTWAQCATSNVLGNVTISKDYWWNHNWINKVK